MTHPDDYTSFDEAEVSREISEKVSRRVFTQEFQALKDRLDKQESLSFNIIIGVAVASFLLVLSLAFSTWLFMASYETDMLNAQASFTSEMSDLREDLKEDNVEFRKTLIGDFEVSEEKQIQLK